MVLKSTVTAVVVALLVVVGLSPAPPLARALPLQPKNPIIGIVTEPVFGGDCVSIFAERYGLPDDLRIKVLKRQSQRVPVGNHSCVFSLYVNWLQASGIRVVPIHWNADDAEIDHIFTRVNGILFPGGILGANDTLRDLYFVRARHIFNKVLAANAAGDPMVVWGTCQGFEMTCAAAAGTTSIIVSGFVGMEPRMMAVNFTKYAASSKMYRNAPKQILEYMTKEATTLNWHHFGVTPASFRTVPGLVKNLKALSTTADVAGNVFVSSVEGTNAAIFAVQFHPERPMFDFTNDAIGHGAHAIEVSMYHSLFLMEQLRLNNHTFESPEDADAATIENYPLYNLGYGIEIYYL